MRRSFYWAWCVWAGPPRKIVLDQQAGFFEQFRTQLEYFGCELDFIPSGARHKLGRAERHNAAWKQIFKKVTDELGVVGPVEVEIASSGTTFAKNSLIRRAGASPQQAVFGRELTLPESLLSSPDELGAHMLMSEDQSVARRAEIRSCAMRKFYEYDLEQAMARGQNAQARRYQGDYAPGETVGVY